MKTIDLSKEWDFVIFETHNEKPNKSKLLKRELLFILQNLLNQISDKRADVNKAFLNEIYHKAKKQYLLM